ncbi:hypothetical protein GWI34_21395, partial [Actinomadura sp. DSM 109109]|nr:hypothetical protein [Actinomadura lepetitiana]
PATPGGLPKRTRVAVAERPARDEEPPAAPDPGAQPPPLRPARETAAGLGAWQRGTRSGRAAGPSGTEGPGIESKDLRP